MWIGVAGTEVGELGWSKSMIGLGCQAKDCRPFPEGDMKALNVLKQRSYIHIFIYPFICSFIRSFMKHYLHVCCGIKQQSVPEGCDQRCNFFVS